MRGFADLHCHQFAQLGFGGQASWGGAYGDMSDALRWCNDWNIHGPGGTADMLGNVMRAVRFHLPLTASAGHAVGGYPAFDGWPRWDNISHQAVHEEWLYRALSGGLRLIVMLAVNNERLCHKTTSPRPYSCDDMDAVDRQLNAAFEMEAYIDGKSGGAGNGWYRIVRTPAEALRAIRSGRLAVVLGIEVDFAFGGRDEASLSEDQLRERLDHYYGMGVRHVFPIHFANNAFGGTAFQNDLVRDVDSRMPSESNPMSVLAVDRIVGTNPVNTEDGTPMGYEYRAGRRNSLGLTDLGRTLIKEMIARGMIIDIDHMSANAKSDTFDVCEAARYPVVSGHAGFCEISRGAKNHEGQLREDEIARLRGLRGMVAVIPSQGNLDDISTWDASGGTVVPHMCGGTSNTFAQAYLYAISKMSGLPVGIGTDLNGFAGQPGPRFGAEACPGGQGVGVLDSAYYPFVALATNEMMERSSAGSREFDINVDGLAHIGMLPDLVADLQSQGLTEADLAPLLDSAEGYVRVWSIARREDAATAAAVSVLAH
jgi:microsomal dipeptidase-like Zn-dependent dipeptidase